MDIIYTYKINNTLNQDSKKDKKDSELYEIQV